MHVRLYRDLRLSQEERARLVAHWNMWRQHIAALDCPFRTALQLLQQLPQPGDLPAAFVSHVSAVADGTVAVNSRRERKLKCRQCRCWSGFSSDVAAQGDVRMHATCAVVAEDLADQDAPRIAAGQMYGRALDRCGADPRQEERVARPESTAAAVPMLGASAPVSVTAVQGFRALVSVHEMHGRVRGELKELQLQPGVVLGPLKIARIMGAHLAFGAAPADMMQVCQLAAAQQRWRAAFVPPQGLSAPLPDYEWLQDDTAAVD